MRSGVLNENNTCSRAPNRKFAGARCSERERGEVHLLSEQNSKYCAFSVWCCSFFLIYQHTDVKIFIESSKMKYILVTGGVISGIGKGVISSSIGALLKGCGLHVTSIKIDPYLNIDAGTFSPYEHGNSIHCFLSIGKLAAI